jgi:tRNA pseudouridine13 synthase
VAKGVYSTACRGIGGQIKRRYADFVVEERTAGGSLCRAERFVGEREGGKSPLVVPENREEKDFLHLDLEKINLDLNLCIGKIARFLQCSKKRVGYAGLKDKRAVTCQRISLYKPNVERLLAFNSRGIDLRNPEWSSERIEIGMLLGNRFTVTIRDIALGEEELKKRLSACFGEIRGGGIANFFGEQRFGGIRKITHLVGREFVKGNPERAVMLYLTATAPQEEESVKRARLALLESRDFAEASKLFPVKYRYERAMIHHLCRHPNDFVGAFRQLPKALMYLFTHAYQSHLFNKALAKRLSCGIGLKKVEGDILVDGKPTAPLFGFECRLAGGKPGEIEETILREEGISLKDFRIKEIPELSSRGARRGIVLQPRGLRLISVADDDFFPGKRLARLSFELEKGSYATTLLREIMKAEE